MADPVVEEKQAAAVPGPTPAIDPELIKSSVRDAVQQYMATEGKDGVHDTDVTLPGGPQATENPLKAVLDPIIGPSIAQARYQGMGARDAVAFFAAHPEAAKYARELNKAFDNALAQGTPYDYETIWAWFRGRPENFDKFVKEGIEAEKSKLASANDATTIGEGARAGSPGAVSAESLNQEQLTEKLKDVAF